MVEKKQLLHLIYFNKYVVASLRKTYFMAASFFMALRCISTIPLLEKTLFLLLIRSRSYDLNQFVSLSIGILKPYISSRSQPFSLKVLDLWKEDKTVVLCFLRSNPSSVICSMNSISQNEIISGMNYQLDAFKILSENSTEPKDF